MGAGRRSLPPRRRAPELAPAVLLLLMFAALGSCRVLTRQLLSPSPAEAQVRLLAVVGDSISHSAADELDAEAQGSGWTLALDATPGAMTVEKQDAASRLAARSPDAAVINLGTNDSMCALAAQVEPGRCRLGAYTHDDRDRELLRMAATLRLRRACVIGVVPWVDAGVRRTWTRLEAGGVIQGVADWRAEALAHEDEYILDPVGHLTDAGQAAYARFVVDAVARSCGPNATSP